MATLSEDGHSWKAGGLKRRDFRHTHDGPEVPRHQAKKNRKRWCRGIVGREHVPGEWVQYRAYAKLPCSVCGKELAWRWEGWRVFK